jgi:hypothetical protein
MARKHTIESLGRFLGMSGIGDEHCTGCREGYNGVYKKYVGIAHDSITPYR